MTKIMVVPAKLLKSHNAVDPDLHCLTVIERAYDYMERSQAEKNPAFRQIIPYVIVHKGSEVALFRRLEGGEPRLTDKLTLGVGGHLDWGPHQNAADAIYQGACREIREETILNPRILSLQIRGVINQTDDPAPVSKVHLGLIYTLELREKLSHIARGDEMEHLGYVDIHTDKKPTNLESWSSLAWDYLKEVL